MKPSTIVAILGTILITLACVGCVAIFVWIQK